MTKNAYIHFPFCKSKCNYCTFISFATKNGQKSYIEALESQIKTEYKNETLDTLYFGGGTPSLMEIEAIEKIIKILNLNQNAEITIEINPETVDKNYLSDLKKIGMNRLSIGSQSFDDKILKQIGRNHDSAQIEKVVKEAQEVRFDNISLDFIYGLPNQTTEGFGKDLKKAIELGVQHISLYGLKIDKGCYFYKNSPQNIADSDEQADMFLKAIETLSGEGFEHYEISNFAKENFYSRHNLNYWKNNSYYGFGLAASGYQNNIRYTNTTNLKKYIENPTLKEFTQKLTLQEQLEEEIFLGLRTKSGIDKNKVSEKFEIDFDKKYEKILQKYSGYIVKTHAGYALSDEGMLLSNEVLSEFIEL